jgi:hypothetical protein
LIGKELEGVHVVLLYCMKVSREHPDDLMMPDGF